MGALVPLAGRVTAATAVASLDASGKGGSLGLWGQLLFTVYVPPSLVTQEQVHGSTVGAKSIAPGSRKYRLFSEL